MLTLTMMPRPTSDHDIEASSWSRHRRLILDAAAAETFYILIKR